MFSNVKPTNQFQNDPSSVLLAVGVVTDRKVVIKNCSTANV